MGERLHKVWGRSDENSGFHGNRKLLTYNGENVVQSITNSFFIGALSNLQVMRTSIKSQTSLISGQIGPLWSYSPLKDEKFSHRLIMEKCCPDDSYFTFGLLFINLADNQNSLKILGEFEFQPDRTIHFMASR